MKKISRDKNNTGVRLNWKVWFAAIIALIAVAFIARSVIAGERYKTFTFTVSTANADQTPDLAPGDYGYSSLSSLTNNVWRIHKCKVDYAGTGVTGISVLLCDRSTVTDRVDQCYAALTALRDGTPVTQTAQHGEYRFWPPLVYRPAASPAHSLTIGYATFGATATGQTVNCWATPEADL